jgi:hypothetical protein
VQLNPRELRSYQANQAPDIPISHASAVEAFQTIQSGPLTTPRRRFTSYRVQNPLTPKFNRPNPHPRVRWIEPLILERWRPADQRGTTAGERLGEGEGGGTFVSVALKTTPYVPSPRTWRLL